MKRLLLGVVRQALLMCLFLGSAAAAEKPNIVFIISDDHDFEMMGFMGHAEVKTPALDTLAENGALFTTAHLPMSRCHPTLASFLSGRWPHQSGIYYNYGTNKLSPENSLPNLLKEAGYATYGAGKYWEGDPREMGFTHGFGKKSGGFVRSGQDEFFDFIDEHRGKQPFFAWWAPRLPHTPHNPSKERLAMYPRDKIQVPEHIKPEHREDFLDREQKILAMVTWLDDGVAELVKKLKDAGEYENTMFVYVIDNGWTHGLTSKGSPFERGLRTPVFFTWPGKIDGKQRYDDLISTHDIYPTILDYAGARIPETAAGQSLRPKIEGKPFKDRERLFGAIYPASATKGDERPERDVYALYMRTEKWKYIWYVRPVPGKSYKIKNLSTDEWSRELNDEDLYDLESDPKELNNLSGDKAHRERLSEYRKAVLQWWSSTGGKELPLDGK